MSVARRATSRPCTALGTLTALTTVDDALRATLRSRRAMTGSKHARKKHHKGKARPGTASKPGTDSTGPAVPAPAAEQTGQSHMTFEEFANEYNAALWRDDDTLDLGGRTVDLGGCQTNFHDRDVTIANCTFRNGEIVCESIDGVAPENIRFENVAFGGNGAGAVACDARQPSPDLYEVGMCGPVNVENVRGISFQNCTFKDATPPEQREKSDACFAPGLTVVNSTVRIDNCRFVNNTGPGLAATGSASLVVVNDSEIRGNNMSGIHSSSGARIDVAGSRLSDNGLDGIFAVDSDVRATETVCSGNRHCGASTTTSAGGGAGSKLVLDRCRMDGNAVAAIMAGGAGARLAATDVECVMGENRHRCRGSLTEGVVCVDGARCTIRGGRISGFHAGFSVRFAGSSIVASNVDCSGGQFGVLAGAGATVRLERATLRRNVCFGIAASGGATVSAGDCEMHLNGAGVGAHGRGQVRLERCSVSGGCFAGVVAHGAGSRIDLEDVEITRYVKSGIEVRDGAQVAMQGGSMTRNKGPGCSAEGRGTVVTLAGVECARNGRANATASDGASVTVDGKVI